MTASRLQTLASVDDLQQALSRSVDRRQLIFKHSAWCPLSAMALSELESHLERGPADADYWLVTVQTDRPVSDAVETRLEVRHESPQALLVRNGMVVWHASHRRITERSLDEALGAGD